MAGRYTIILEFEGGTYIAQVDTENEKSAFDFWIEKIKTERTLAKRTGRFINALQRQERDLTPISDVTGVWYFRLIFADKSVYGHVISTSS